VQAFVVYLVASKRSIRELLDPRPQDIADTFVRKFSGMTDSDIGLDALVEIQAQLPGILMSLLSGDDKQFLLSFKRGDPDWSLLPIPHARDLPAVKWKQLNLDRMYVEDRKEAIEKLESLLN
jgi:hypothetical protein